MRAAPCRPRAAACRPGPPVGEPRQLRQPHQPRLTGLRLSTVTGHTGCSVRVHIVSTLADIAMAQVCVSLVGEHVPRGVTPAPPPLNGLKPMPAALQLLRQKCAEGGMPSVVINTAVSSLGEGAERNTRLAPPGHVLAGIKKRDKRRARGGSMDDATRVDVLVRRHLIQRNMVLLYIPGQQLVLTTPWALERARVDGRFMIATDAKVDTVTGVRSNWTSVRFKTLRGLSVPGTVWIAPKENNETIERGMHAIRCNVHCDSPSCPHTLIETYAPDGSYERHLSCELWWQPACCIDKHIPSFNGLRAVGLSDIMLCDYHGYNCFDSRLVDLGIRGDAADQINWGFRLLTRAASDAAAFDLRDSLACMLVRHAATPVRLWTLANAEAVIKYIDKCWMYPDMIRRSWIDANGLKLANTLAKKSYFLNTTGIAEWSHSHWTKIMMKAQTNKLVSETIVKTVGVTADGELAVGGGFFQDAQTRWSDADGRTLPESTDRKVRHAKACLAFLSLGADCVYPHTLDGLSVEEFKALASEEAAEGEEVNGGTAAEEGEADGEVHAWRRHRRESGGRMSSQFRQLPIRSPTNAELTKLAIGACFSIHEQQIADNVPLGERGVSLSDVRLLIEPQLAVLYQGGIDLYPHRACLKQGIDEYCLDSCARSAGCTLVPRLANDSIRRHAEAPSMHRTAHGLSPEFPAALKPMCQLLAHGGPLSFSKDNYVSVDDATGRCECLDSTYHGVLSAVMMGGCDDERGACKHDQLRRLCLEAATSVAANAAVRERCAGYLCSYVYERERGKPRAQRCMPLYTAGSADDIDALLVALRSHASIPHSGKGVASSSGTQTADAMSDAESDAGALDEDAAAVEAVESLQTSPRRHCTFAAAQLAINGFGVTFVPNTAAGGGVGIVVAAFSALGSGGYGPATHTGEQLQPHDVVLSVGGHSSDSDLTKLLSPTGQLTVPAGSTATTLEFVRLGCASASVYLGGRPARTKAKHGRNAPGKARASQVRDAELLGGAPSRVGRKPQRSRARDVAATDAGEPSFDEQVEAAFRVLRTRVSEEQQRELQRIINEVEQRLLARRELDESERAAWDAELQDMVYSQ